MKELRCHKEQTFVDSLAGKPSINLHLGKKKPSELEGLQIVYGVGICFVCVCFHLVAPWYFNLILAQVSDVLQSEPVTLFRLVFRETFFFFFYECFQ